MISLIHQTALYLHVLIGSAALIIFWLPMLTKKGGQHHRFYGQLFVNGMYAVAISGFLMSTLVLIDPLGVRFADAQLELEQSIAAARENRIFAGFLLMLSVLVFSNVRQSIVVLRAKADRNQLKTPWHVGMLLLLGLLGITMEWIGIQRQILLFQIFAAICILNSAGGLRYIFKTNIKQREWIVVHLGNIIGAGIGAYTAFFAFGGSRFFSEFFSGSYFAIPWLIPAIVGLTASVFLTKKYSREFRIN